MNNKKIKRIKFVLFFQFFWAMLMSIFVWSLYDMHTAVSSFMGGMVAFIPALLFVIIFFRQNSARAAKQIVRCFYIGEFIKIASSVCLFALVFMFYKVTPLAFFLTYIAVVMMHWLAPLIVDSKQHRPESD